MGVEGQRRRSVESSVRVPSARLAQGQRDGHVVDIRPADTDGPHGPDGCTRGVKGGGGHVCFDIFSRTPARPERARLCTRPDAHTDSERLSK